MNNNISPFVKWAGGKGQLLERLKFRMPEQYNRYYEPFIGGGALLFGTTPEVGVINDTNEQLINVYRQLQNEAEEVIQYIKTYDSIPCSKERYYDMRAKFNNKIQSGELDPEAAALLIWINKHCFNGLYRVNKKGGFNVPFNNNINGRSMDEENLRGIGEFLKYSDIQIRNADFVDACSDVEAGDFVYFDSPYVPVNKTANFTDYTKDGFTYEDHLRLAELFKALDAKGVKIMLSNNNVPLVHDLYQGYNIQTTDVRRAINSVASKRESKEVIITNY